MPGNEFPGGSLARLSTLSCAGMTKIRSFQNCRANPLDVFPVASQVLHEVDCAFTLAV
jgi:hypothetical protein